MRDTYYVAKYTKSGVFVCIMAGLGRNAGTWDAGHSKRTAQRHARALRLEWPHHDFKVEIAHYS